MTTNSDSPPLALHKPTLLFCAALMDAMRKRVSISASISNLRREVLMEAFDAAASEIAGLASGPPNYPPETAPPLQPSSPDAGAALAEVAAA